MIRVFLGILLMVLFMPLGRADTGYVDPDGDVTTEWMPVPSGTHYTTVDDAIRQPNTPNTSDYVWADKGSLGPGVKDEFNMGTISGVGTVSSIEVWYNAYIGPQAVLGINVYLDGEWKTAQQEAGGLDGADGWFSKKWTGTWDQTDLDNLQVRISLDQDMNFEGIIVYALYAEITYTPPSPATTLKGVTLKGVTIK